MCLWTQHNHDKFMISAGFISCIFQNERRKCSKRDIDSNLCLWINAQHAYHRLITIFIQNVVLSASPAWSCHSDIKSHISGRNQNNKPHCQKSYFANVNIRSKTVRNQGSKISQRAQIKFSPSGDDRKLWN